MSYHPWWMTTEARCQGPASQRPEDPRCHNLAKRDGLCAVHLRRAGKGWEPPARALIRQKLRDVLTARGVSEVDEIVLEVMGEVK